MTPEARVKDMIKKELLTYADRMYVHWPVLNGMGAPELDCNLVINGYAVSIEAKAPDERMTKRQKLTAKAKRTAGGLVFEVESGFDMSFVLRALDALICDDRKSARAEELTNSRIKENG